MQRDPDFLNESLGSRLYGAGEKFTKGYGVYDDLVPGVLGKLLRGARTSAMIGSLLIPGGERATSHPYHPQGAPPAMVAQINQKPSPLASTAQDFVKSITDEDSPLDQAIADAEDWVPDEAERRRKAQARATKMVANMPPAATKPVVQPPDAIDPSVPRTPRLTPRMRAQLRAKQRRHH